jgi:UrcA family protein
MTKFNMTIATAAFIAAGICVGAATGAAAEPAPFTTKVSYAGLDLSSDAGKATMERRIAQAAKQVCGFVPTEKLLTVRAERIRCTRETSAAASAELARVAPTVIASR